MGNMLAKHKRNEVTKFVTVYYAHMYGMIYIVHRFCPQIENLSPSIPKLAIHLESGGTHLFWGYNQQTMG